METCNTLLCCEAPEDENKVQENIKKQKKSKGCLRNATVTRVTRAVCVCLWLSVPLTDLNNNLVCQLHLTRLFPNPPSLWLMMVMLLRSRLVEEWKVSWSRFREAKLTGGRTAGVFTRPRGINCVRRRQTHLKCPTNKQTSNAAGFSSAAAPAALCWSSSC